MAITKKKTIPFNFGSKHIDYIRNCATATYNVAEGAVRAGKTVDNVYAFAHELKTPLTSVIGYADNSVMHIFSGQRRIGRRMGL